MIEEKQAKRLGAQIKALRLSRNESQLEFGKNFFPSAAKGVVSRWESGKSIPSPERLAKIAEMSGKTVTELLNGTTSNVISQIAENLSKIVDRACLAPTDDLFPGERRHKSKEDIAFEKFAIKFFECVFQNENPNSMSEKLEKKAIEQINNCASKVQKNAKEMDVQPFQTCLLYQMFLATARAFDNDSFAGDRIKKIRLKRGIDQSQLADMLGVSTATISRWENNESVPRVKKMKRIVEIENGDGKNSLKTETLPKMNFPKATLTGMNGKQFTEYLTPFKDDVGDDVTFVYDTDIKAYTDDAYCMYELTNAGIDDDYQRRIMQKVADEYGCEFNNDELLSNDPTVLLQAILAVYAWLKLKEMD